MAIIHLVEGTAFIRFSELPKLLARALHPPPRAPDDGNAAKAELAAQQEFLVKADRKRRLRPTVPILDWELAAERFEDELAREVSEGRLPLRNPLTHAPQVLARGSSALRSALVAVHELRAYLVGSGVEIVVGNKPRQTEQLAIACADMPMKRAALVKAHQHDWPTIESDLKDASKNGLSDAKLGIRGWDETRALAWARSKGKLRDADANVLAESMTRMTKLPGVTHKLDR